MKQYDLYLFDFDGTLVDSYDSLVDIFVYSFRAIGYEIDPKNVIRYMRIPLEETYAEIGAPLEKADEFEKAIRFYLNDESMLKKTKIYPETINLLNALHNRGKKLGIVTSNNEKHVLDVLKLFDIPSDIFEIYVDSDKIKETKPSPKPLLFALEEMNFMNNKDKAAYVGDGMNDMKSAVSAGIDAILVDRVNHFEESSTYIKIKDLNELL